MRLLHLIPVGRSLLDQIDRGVLPALQPALAVDELPDSADTVGEALQRATGQHHELDMHHLGLTDVPRAASAADSSMAAEWTSVSALADESRYGAVDGQAYVFIASDSDDGLRAATLVAARYRHITIRYLHEPLTVGCPPVDPGDVYVCRIPDLDLGARQPTSTTWRSLGAVGRLVAETAEQTGGGEWNVVVVHLSGGYKAMIPYLMVLAEGIHSRLRDVELGPGHRPKIRAVAIHDPSAGRDSTTSRIVIEIPVRAIVGDLLTDAKRLAALTRPDSDIVGADAPKDLRGLFIERVDGRSYRLTAAGLIMVNVL